MTILEIINLQKSFKKNLVLDNLYFSLTPGIYALVGKNGIGKSTLLEIIAGVTQPDHGTINFSGLGNPNSIAYKKRLVYVPCKPSFFPNATGEEYLELLSVLKKTKTNLCLKTAIDEFNIANQLHKEFHSLSLGAQKKLFLAGMCIGDNSLIILDEPTNGLDEVSIIVLANLLKTFKKNAVILLATHDKNFINMLDTKFIYYKSANEIGISGF